MSYNTIFNWIRGVFLEVQKQRNRTPEMKLNDEEAHSSGTSICWHEKYH